jgi:hypothetical protein
MASSNLALLPLKTEPLEHLNEYLNQVGNYAYVLSYKMLEGEKVTDIKASLDAETLRAGVMLRRGKKSYKKVVLA